METFEVLTGQHVAIEYKPASVAQRMGALLLDSLIQTAYVISVYILSLFRYDYSFWDDSDLHIILLFILIVPTLVYHFLFEWLMNGQTPGKRALKIKVTNDDGSATRVGAYFLRWLLRPIDLIFYGGVGALCILLTKKHQRLGDMAAGTVVVQTRPKQSVFRSDYYTFPPNYQPKYPQAASLTPGQIQLISQMLSAAPRFSDEIKLQTLAQKVREIVRIDESTVGNTTDNRRFLENIIRDYHYYDSLGI